MGWLENTTTDVIVDCVLTDKGREAIARNDGSFSIVQFACSDDEVDYSVIRKFGRTVGKEKIEKNTGVFEALTNQGYAQKYRLVSVSNQNLLRLPNLTLTGVGVSSTSSVISLGSTITRRVTVTVEQAIQDESSIQVELRDQAFLIEMNNLFLQVPGRTPENIDFQQRATYLIDKDSTETGKGGSRATIPLESKSISDSQFQVYGAQNNKSMISTFIKISGLQSGAVIEYEVQITKGV